MGIAPALMLYMIVCFSLDVPVKQRSTIFLRKYCDLNNVLCSLFTSDAQRQLALVQTLSH